MTREGVVIFDGIRYGVPWQYNGYKVWNVLNDFTTNDLESEGRVYGGGLKKIEPKELSYVKCPRLTKLLT